MRLRPLRLARSPGPSATLAKAVPLLRLRVGAGPQPGRAAKILNPIEPS
jgi:hypothetical protein